MYCCYFTDVKGTYYIIYYIVFNIDYIEYRLYLLNDNKLMLQNESFP